MFVLLLGVVRKGERPRCFFEMQTHTYRNGGVRANSIFFIPGSCYFSGGVFFCCTLVPSTLALDLPTLNLQRLVFLCLTVTTEFVSLG